MRFDRPGRAQAGAWWRHSPRHCAITVGHLSDVARSGLGMFHGVCSSYLCASAPEKVIYAFVRDTGSGMSNICKSDTIWLRFTVR